MANSNKKQSGGFISNAFGVAKKLSETGLSVMNHVAPGTVSKLTQAPKQEQIVQGSAKEKSAFERKKYDNPQQMMREHLPNVTGKLLGKHYKKVNNIASFISPDLNDRLSDFIFDKLNEFVADVTSVDALLKEVGAKDLNELVKDPARSQRISTALANQNKMIAAIQGMLTGAVGGVGAMIDVPTSLALTLRSIYHTGHAYGFELNVKDQNVVEYIFKEIDLGSVAEKQALMAAIRTFAGVLETHNVSQLQQLLGSGNDIEVIRKWLANEDGSFKLPWLNQLPRFGLLTRLTPLATIGISAVYSWKLVDDATDKAQIVFAGARQYLLEHPNEKIDTLEAYEKSIQAVSETQPLLLKDVPAEIAEDIEKPVAPSQVEVENKASIQKNAVQTNAIQTDVTQKVASQEKTVQVETPVQQSKTQAKPRATSKAKTDVTQTEKANAQAAETAKEKPVSTRIRKAPQKVEQSNVNTEKATTVAKTPTNTRTVTKKRTPAKPKVASENATKTPEKTPEKTLENPENKSE